MPTRLGLSVRNLPPSIFAVGGRVSPGHVHRLYSEPDSGLQLPFLDPIATVFVWIALLAWGLTFAGLVGHLIKSKAERTTRDAARS